MFTFIVTPVIFRSYSRDAAGDIVGKLFPMYFLFCIAVAAAALVTLLLMTEYRSTTKYIISIILVILALCSSIYLKFYLHPEIVSVKQQIASFETVSAEDPLRKKFRSLHAKSAVLNLAMLADGLTLLLMGLGFRRGQ